MEIECCVQKHQTVVCLSDCYILFFVILLLHNIFIAEKLSAVDTVLLVGDNFCSISYRKHFLLRQDNEKGFIKDRFEFKPYCNSCYNSATANMLVRLQNTFTRALNENNSMPKFILVILDDDLIQYLNFKEAGASQLLGSWIEWLSQQFTDALHSKRDKLPRKAQQETCIYWVLPPLHHDFS